ncbi:mCG144858, partial [Mus musculus]
TADLSSTVPPLDTSSALTWITPSDFASPRTGVFSSWSPLGFSLANSLGNLVSWSILCPGEGCFVAGSVVLVFLGDPGLGSLHLREFPLRFSAFSSTFLF